MSQDDNSIERMLSALFQLRGNHNQQGPEGQSTALTSITLADLQALLSARSSTVGLHDDDDDNEYEDEDDDLDFLGRRRAMSRPQKQWIPPFTEPQAAGVELLHSGDFGYLRPKHGSKPNLSNVTRSILGAASKPPRYVPSEEIKTNLVPNTNGTTVATYDANIYTAQFSADSSFYYTCAQDFKLHIFDMTKPSSIFGPVRTHMPRAYGRSGSLKTSLPLRKEIQGQHGQWTVTDANLSPDNSRIIYSSIMSTVYMTSTSPEGSLEQIPIHFGDRRGMQHMDQFGIWSCRFSADGKEVVAGGDGKIFVYDLLANKRTVKIPAHYDDVNSCCWADTGSGNVLISASDDTFLKVWDRRSLGASAKPSGVLVGHTEGITYVSAKGDGRYVISNGKDQALRLWDLRKMCSTKNFETIQHDDYGLHFDYRVSSYPKPRYDAHPENCSVMTYRGHSVLRTLIRCHFSPAETTGSQYIYSGSADGRIHVWSLDGRVVQVLDRSKTLPSSFSPSGPEPEPLGVGEKENTCVRDVSWHTQEPVIMSAAWDNMRGGTVIARHEWKGLSKMLYKLEDWVEKEQQEAEGASIGKTQPSRRQSERLYRQRHTSLHVPGSYIDDDDDDASDSEYLEEAGSD